MGGACEWRWCMEFGSWILNLNMWMSTAEITIDLIWLVETVRPSSLYLFKQYSFTAGGNLHQSWLVTINTFSLVVLVCAPKSIHRFQFSLVQPQLWPYGFRFWTRRLLEHFWCKSYGWFEFGSMVMKFKIFIEKSLNLWNREIEGLGLKNKFAERFRHQNSWGFCAARNVQDVGGVTRMSHGWWLWITLVHGIWVMNF